ncbi:MAG: OmpA family protein [Methylococcales bacterium]
MKIQRQLYCLFGFFALTHLGYADEINFGKQRPTASQVIEALSPATANAEGTENGVRPRAKYRSIGPLTPDYQPVAHSEVKHKAKIKNARKSTNEKALSLEVLFRFSSAELTDIAKQQLDPVGEALSSEKLQRLEFIVEGHTDAVGGNTYNKILSKERADSVKLFLTDKYHIAPARLQIIGKGKSNLLDRKHPESEVNRRVRIIALQ